MTTNPDTTGALAEAIGSTPSAAFTSNSDTAALGAADGPDAGNPPGTSAEDPNAQHAPTGSELHSPGEDAPPLDLAAMLQPSGEPDISPEERRRRAELAKSAGPEAETAYRQVMGTPIGGAKIGEDVKREIQEKGVSGLLETLRMLGDRAATFTADDGKEYVLLGLLDMRNSQRRKIAELIERAKGYLKVLPNGTRPFTKPVEGKTAALRTMDGIANAMTDVGEILEAAEASGLAAEIFANMYTPKGYRYTGERAQNPEYIALFNDLEIGIQLGGLYRFFLSSVPWLEDVIRTYCLAAMSQV